MNILVNKDTEKATTKKDINEDFTMSIKMIKYTWKSCSVNISRFLKYVWPFFNIMQERVNYRDFPITYMFYTILI